MFAFGLPQHSVAWISLLLALLVLWPRLRLPAFVRKRPRLVLAALCASAAALSLGYFYFYLGGSARLIDATTYLFQARALAQPDAPGFCTVMPGPSALYRGRFLLASSSDPHCIGGIFPAGYPALLSLGVAIGHYEWIGPLLAAGLVLVTYQLTLIITRRRPVAELAALLSVLSACLRYHTADTMSHGWSALLTATSVLITVQLMGTQALSERRARSALLRHALLLGASLGLLIATRQFTGLLVSLGCVGSLGWTLRRQPKLLGRILPAVALTSLIGLGLLGAQNLSLTGQWSVSPQLAYYARADGPPGCFGIGLGKGCHYEHADVVAQQGGHGLTWKWVLLNTLHRLHWHSLDIANFEPLLLVALWGGFALRRQSATRPLLWVLTLLPLGYGFFYFNGSYPGGGARFFSELIPLWHVFLAVGLFRLRAVRAGISACLLGFALHASISHALLLSPHFGPRPEPQLAEQLAQKTPRALLSVTLAHHFNLYAQTFGLDVVHQTHDSRQDIARAQLAPDALFDLSAAGELQPLTLPSGAAKPGLAAPEILSLEAEYDYPVLDLSGAWVHPEHLALPCVSLARALRVHRVEPSGNHPSTLNLELTAPRAGRYDVSLVIVESSATLSPQCRTWSLGQHSVPGQLVVPLDSAPQLTHIDRILLTEPHH